MPRTTRPPPHILLVHDGLPYEMHVKHMTDAGLRVSTSHRSSALSDAEDLQPDIIVLDFGSDGDTTAAIKANRMTEHIPVIALIELRPQG
jgi:DNA-binding response OmpR family regulator